MDATTNAIAAVKAQALWDAADAGELCDFDHPYGRLPAMARIFLRERAAEIHPHFAALLADLRAPAETPGAPE